MCTSAECAFDQATNRPITGDKTGSESGRQNWTRGDRVYGQYVMQLRGDQRDRPEDATISFEVFTDQGVDSASPKLALARNSLLQSRFLWSMLQS